MVDLRRFPVSDEFISDRYTICVILDRRKFIKILNYWFRNFGHVTPEDMRIDWEHSRIPAGPASGRNRPLNSRNLGCGQDGTLF